MDHVKLGLCNFGFRSMNLRKHILLLLVTFLFVAGIIPVCLAQSKNHYIVQFETGHPSVFGPGKSAYALTRNGVIKKLPSRARHVRDLGIINAIVVEASDASDLWVAGVTSVIPDPKARIHLTESLSQINVPAARIAGYRGAGVTVGVVDTGVDYLHPDIAANYVGGYDTFDNDNDPMDEYYHGTHVAATIIAVAPDIELYGIKTFPAGPNTDWSYIIEGIEWAVDPNGDGDTSDHLDIINLSLGSVGTPDDFRCQAIHAATEAGVIAIISVGNWGYSGTIDSPGICADAISVGATRKSEPSQIAQFSSQGPALWFPEGRNMMKPDVVAPGLAICAAVASVEQNFPPCHTDPKRVNLNGTSMAAPHVTGVVALIKGAHPTYGTEEVRRALRGSAIPFPYATSDERKSQYVEDVYGAGEVNALGAVEFNLPPTTIVESTLHPTAVYLGNVVGAGSHSIPFIYTGPSISVTTTGYNIITPSTIAGDFTATLTLPSSLPSGLYQSRIVVGDHVHEAIIVFLIDKAPPSAPILLEPDISQPITSPFMMRWQVSDDACIKTISRSRPESDGTTTVTSYPINNIPEIFTNCQSIITLYHGTLSIPDGTYDLYAEVSDLAGNIVMSNIYPVTIGMPPPDPDPDPPIDITPPEVVITSPLTGVRVPRRTGFTVNVDATDVSGVEFVQMSWKDGGCIDRTFPFSCHVPTTGKPNARYNVNVSAQDMVGNRSDVIGVVVRSEGKGGPKK